MTSCVSQAAMFEGSGGRESYFEVDLWNVVTILRGKTDRARPQGTILEKY